MLKNKYLKTIFSSKYFSDSFELENGKSGTGIFNNEQQQSNYGFVDTISDNSELIIQEEDVLNLDIKENLELSFDGEVIFKIKTIKKIGDGTASLKLERQ